MTKSENKRLSHILAFGKNSLAKVSDSASLDAQVLMAHVLGENRAWLLAHPEYILSQQQDEKYKNYLIRLEKGEALAYILGEWEFFGLPFYVTPDVLIPRPETEILIETSMDWVNNRGKGLKMVDVGTGSGIIPISLASEIKDLEISAIDLSLTALKIAKKNAARHDLTGRIEFLHDDLLSNIEKKFDLITANLPYIPTETLKTLKIYKTEPSIALDGGSDGLILIRRLLQQAPSRLNPGGLIMLEIEYRQGEAVKELARKAFPNAIINIKKDLAGLDRLVVFQT